MAKGISLTLSGILCTFVVFNVITCQESQEKITEIPDRKLNGHIELDTLDILPTTERYGLQLVDNSGSKGSDKDTPYLPRANEVKTINKTALDGGYLATPVESVQGALLSAHAHVEGPTETSGQGEIFGEDGLQKVLDHRTENKELSSENIDAFNDQTNPPELDGEIKDMEDIMSNEAITDNYEFTKNLMETDKQIEEIINILSKDNGKNQIEAVEIVVNSNIDENFEETTENGIITMLTDNVDDDFENITTEIISTTTDFEESSTILDMSSFLKSGENIEMKNNVSENENTEFGIGSNDLTSREVESYYNKILDDNINNNYDDSSESTGNEVENFENDKNNAPQLIIAKIYGNLANFSICIERKNVKLFIPNSVYIKQSEGEIIFLWKSQISNINNSLIIDTIRADLNYDIIGIELNLINDNILVSTKKIMLITPFGENSKTIEMDDGTKIWISNLDFLKTISEENEIETDIWEFPSITEKTWKLEIFAISISLVVLMTSCAYFVIYKIKKRNQLKQKNEAQETKC